MRRALDASLQRLQTDLIPRGIPVDVVELVDVDVIRLKSLEAGVQCPADAPGTGRQPPATSDGSHPTGYPGRRGGTGRRRCDPSEVAGGWRPVPGGCAGHWTPASSDFRRITSHGVSRSTWWNW